MSSNPPPSIVLLPSSSSSSSTSTPTSAPIMINPSNSHSLSHQNLRSPIIFHQPTSSPSLSSSAAIPFRSVIVKPYRDSIQQALSLSTNNPDVKPILIQAADNNNETHPPTKRLALDSSDLNNVNLTFSVVPKAEVLTALQPVQSANPASFSTLRLVTPSVQTTAQPVLLQQHANLVITQPVVTLQVQHDPNAMQKENSSAASTQANSVDQYPIQYQRKPCNCTKSMCLKLYCDCFANGLNCQNCSCLNCHNDARHEEERNKAVAATLERNPNAFKSKMYKFASTTVAQPDRPLKGCNCKKSSCHKRYCECYESRVPCTSLCKCIGCKNTESSVHPLNVGFYRTGEPKTTNQTPLDRIPRTGPPVENTVPNNVFNMEVTEALASCLLATGQQCESNQMNDHDSQEALLREFQRCMHQIVQSALGRADSSKAFV